MADEGPTTAGSIVGKLKMDRDQWVKDKAATIADARELGSLDPTITVHANVAEALAQIEALHAASGDSSTTSTTTVGTTVSAGSTAKVDSLSAAEAKLAAALSAADTAYARAALSQMKLDAAQANGRTTEIQLAAATLANTEAMKKLDAANAKALATEAALAEAQQKAAKAALEDAAAQETQAKATDNAGKSMSRIQMILTAVIALGPGLIPIAGFAVGAGAAIAGMAAVGVLAILGIRNELKNGTADANEFAAGIASLKIDVAQLEATAAGGVLAGFQNVVSQVKADMPELNSETALYSRFLGAIAATGFGGVLSSFHSLAPLIIDVDAYLLSTTNRLSQFAASPSMRQFVTYAQQNLPTVERLLDSLVQMAFHVLAAFAPWGNVVVGTLQAVANVINAIPTPVLSTLIELALGGSIAFKAWTSIPGMFMSLATSLGLVAEAEGGATVATGALGAAIDFMTGPIGWVAAGIGALVAVLVASSAANSVATQTTNAYTAALQQDNGVIGENVRQQAAKNLQDSGALDNAKKLGISTATLVSASLGHAGAIKTVSDALDKQTAKLDAGVKAAQGNRGAALQATQTQHDQRAAIDNVSQSMATQTGDLKASMKAYNDYQTAIGGATVSTQDQYLAVVDLSRRYGMSVSAYTTAKAAQKATADQLAATTRAMYLQNDAGGLLQQTLDKLNGKSITAAQAQNTFDSQLANMSQHLNAAGNQIDRANTLLTGMTAAAVANRGELINLTTAAEANADAYRNQTDAQGNLIHSSDDTIAKMQDMKKTIVDNAVAHGENRAQVQQFVDALFTIPASIPPVKIDADTAAATAKINALLALEKQLNVGQAAAGSSQKQNRTSLTGHAGGGTVTGFGGPTSDNQIRALSVGEEVTRTSRAQAFRPMLKAINNGSKDEIRNQAARIAGPSSAPAQVVNHYWSVITQADPTAAIKDGIRQLSARTA